MSEDTSNIMTGVCHFYSETVAEGGLWAFQNEKFIRGPTTKFPHGRWSYTGLHILKSGDYLTVFDPKDTEVVIWEGIVSLKLYDLFTETVEGLWIHADQIGVERGAWAKWFFDRHPAKLIQGKK